MITDAALVGIGMDIRMTAVPRHELGRRDATRQVLAGNLETSVAACPIRVDHSVDGLAELCNAEVGANGNIAIEPDTWASPMCARGYCGSSDEKWSGATP